MPNRNRWHAEVARTFLLWVEETTDDPPWTGHVLRRPWKFAIETPNGPEMHTTRPWQDSFVARNEAIAKDGAITTVRNCFPEYAHRLDEANWVQFEISDEEWNQRIQRFIEGKRG
jgi:hypothetical protein